MRINRGQGPSYTSDKKLQESLLGTIHTNRGQGPSYKSDKHL